MIWWRRAWEGGYYIAICRLDWKKNVSFKVCCFGKSGTLIIWLISNTVHMFIERDDLRTKKARRLSTLWWTNNNVKYIQKSKSEEKIHLLQKLSITKVHYICIHIFVYELFYLIQTDFLKYLCGLRRGYTYAI